MEQSFISAQECHTFIMGDSYFVYEVTVVLLVSYYTKC